ncbi:MAG TPA: archease [Gaiellaceae bacterium]|nr:archease [Gaiellaceae bacterium]
MYCWVDHTAELELHIEAETLRDVFAEALEAFAELVGNSEGEPAVHELLLTAADRASLLVQWLEELVYLADTQAFVPWRATSLKVGRTELRARVEGVRGSPRPLVKAVTYHGLELARREGAWRARVVLDV